MDVMANKRTGKKLPKEWIAAMDAIASMWRGDLPSWIVNGGAA